jgi:hypothetical protein
MSTTAKGKSSAKASKPKRTRKPKYTAGQKIWVDGLGTYTILQLTHPITEPGNFVVRDMAKRRFWIELDQIAPFPTEEVNEHIRAYRTERICRHMISELEN